MLSRIWLTHSISYVKPTGKHLALGYQNILNEIEGTVVQGKTVVPKILIAIENEI